jgi:hypothetical protein
MRWHVKNPKGPALVTCPRCQRPQGYQKPETVYECKCGQQFTKETQFKPVR